jgi:hypothetical protein
MRKGSALAIIHHLLCLDFQVYWGDSQKSQALGADGLALVAILSKVKRVTTAQAHAQMPSQN